eukprot:Nk52_evm1s1172 gene=Nk52_evmTU1s1172
MGAVRGGDDDEHRLPRLDQGDGPVLELAGGETLGMDVGDLLELERALHRGGVADVAAQEQHALGVDHVLGELLDLRGAVQHLLDLLGDLLEVAHQGGDLVGEQVAAHLGQEQSQQVAGGDLTEVRLGRGHRDLGADVQVQRGIGLARDGRAAGVADRDDLRALLAGVADRHQGVHGLARLGDRHDQRLLGDDGVA